MSKLLSMLALALALALVGAASLIACGGDSNAKNACDKLSSCNLSSSGFSCDASKESDCAACLNDTSCGDIQGGKCAPRCPGATFNFKPK